jgi:hypothetical protein
VSQVGFKLAPKNSRPLYWIAPDHSIFGLSGGRFPKKLDGRTLTTIIAMTREQMTMFCSIAYSTALPTFDF